MFDLIVLLRLRIEQEIRKHPKREFKAYFYNFQFIYFNNIPVDDASAVQVVECLNNATCVEPSCLIVKVTLVPEDQQIFKYSNIVPEDQFQKKKNT